jgi:hypothetical protein
MRLIAALPCLILLAACGPAQPPAKKERIADPEMRGDVLPVMGRERRVTIIAAGPIDGARLTKAETYPARLENALRARGVNARLHVVRTLDEARREPGELVVVTDGSQATALLAEGVRAVAPRMSVPAGLGGPDAAHPDARGVEELVAQSADQIAAALPKVR